MTDWATPLVSGLVALLVAGVSALLTLAQLRREHRKWIIELKVTLSVELHKKRMETYPDVLRILGALSHANPDGVTTQTAGHVAYELNTWLYSAGGLCAEATTRGAIFGLRKSCRSWVKTGTKPDDLYSWRNLSIAFLRRDLDLTGLEDYDFDQEATVLTRLQTELAAAEKKSRP